MDTLRRQKAVEMDDDADPTRISPYLLEMPPSSVGRTLLATGFAYYCALHWGLSEEEIAAAFAGEGGAIDRDAVLGSAALLGGLFAKGAIRGWVRPMGGGEPAALKESVWEVDDFARRFATSAIDPRRPFDEGTPPTHWIFADAADWTAMIEASVADVANHRSVARPRAPAAVATPTSVALDGGDLGGGGYLRMPDVERLTGLSRSTIYRKMDASRFPRSVQLSDNAAGWRERDVATWLADPR